uniref:(northern house mosquito) hypothetical protein n=1 Tax=Culex pipiens TaxID=7175 RepID=A0A8D8GLH0_CULPI
MSSFTCTSAASHDSDSTCSTCWVTGENFEASSGTSASASSCSSVDFLALSELASTTGFCSVLVGFSLVASSSKPSLAKACSVRSSASDRRHLFTNRYAFRASSTHLGQASPGRPSSSDISTRAQKRTISASFVPRRFANRETQLASCRRQRRHSLEVIPGGTSLKKNNVIFLSGR